MKFISILKATIKQPPGIFLITGFILLVISFIINSDNAIDIHLHDTYFVITHTHILRIIAGLFFLIYAIYWVFRKILFSNLLSWLHVLLTLPGITVLISPLHYFHTSTPSYTSAQDIIAPLWYLYSIQSIAILAISVGQLAFVLNIFAGLVKLLVKRAKV